MKIVTSGCKYIDIDAYAGCVAYAELLNMKNLHAKAVCTAPWNESITSTVRSWNAPLETVYLPAKQDTFTLIDISEPKYFENFVVLDRVDEVIDHHLGFEVYWQKRLGQNAHIEFIGAACTLVYESWKAAGLVDKMSVTCARLLVCGILDNTLNFGAKITTDRDKQAYKALFAKSNLPDDWAAQYFLECQDAMLQDIAAAVAKDTKNLTYKTFEQPINVGQLAVWDGKTVVANYQAKLQKALASLSPNYYVNLISVGEGKSYFITDNVAVQEWLSKMLGIHFNGSVATADRLWLRKEIKARDITRRNP